MRDTVYFTLRESVDPNDHRLQGAIICPPIETDFSKEEIRYFKSYFYGYLIGIWDNLRHRPHRPFARCVPASLLIFGYHDGKVFEEQYDSIEAFESAWQSHLKRQQATSECEIQADPFQVRTGPAGADL